MDGISGTAKQTPARRNLEQQSSPAEDTASLAAYIADMTAELADLAGKARLPMLAYFLNLARVEAQIHAKENRPRENESGSGLNRFRPRAFRRAAKPAPLRGAPAGLRDRDRAARFARRAREGRPRE